MKRCLHFVSDGVSVWQPVTYVTHTEFGENKIEFCDLKGTFYLIQILTHDVLSINLGYMLQAEPFEKIILTSYDITFVT